MNSTSPILKLYHGTKSGISGEIAPVSRDACDFGSGFYLGNDPVQPMTLICRESAPKFYTCELDLSGLSVYTFTSAAEWALFIAHCRGKSAPFAGTPLYDHIASIANNYDVITGKIANDRMFIVLNSFFDNAMTLDGLVASLQILKLGNQYCAKTPRACRQIRILEERTISAEECNALREKNNADRKTAVAMTEKIRIQYLRQGLFFNEFFEKYATDWSQLQ